MISSVFTKAAIAGAALVTAQAVSAGTIDFEAIADGASFTTTAPSVKAGGEGGWNTIVGAGLGIVDLATGISVIGSATTSAGSTISAYFDSGSAGLGACSNLTSAGQCSPSNDDNVGAIGGSANAAQPSQTFETLTLTFSQAVKITDLIFAAEGHGLFTGSIKINGTDTAIAGGTLLGPLYGSVFDFQYLPVPVGTNPNFTNEFYIDQVTIAAVPVPAAGLLLLTALGGLGVARRRRKTA